MRASRVTALLAILGSLPVAPPGLHAQAPHDAGLAAATARALEPGVRAALKDGRPVSFEHRSDWSEAVKVELEEALGLSLTAEHRRGASQIVLGAPRLDEDRAVVDVWFGRCEAHAGSEILRIRMYSFTFRRDGNEWDVLRAARRGTSEGSCDGEPFDPGAVQA